MLNEVYIMINNLDIQRSLLIKLIYILFIIIVMMINLHLKNNLFLFRNRNFIFFNRYSIKIFYEKFSIKISSANQLNKSLLKIFSD